MQNRTRFAEGRPRDILCLGRFGVDFYAQQIGARLEDVTSFAKYLGGSSANTAFGCARLGLNGRPDLARRRRRDGPLPRRDDRARRLRRQPRRRRSVAAHRGRRPRHQGQGHVPADLPARELRRHGDRRRRDRGGVHRAKPRAADHRHAFLDAVHQRHQQPRARPRARARRAHGARHRLPAGAVGTHQARRRRDALHRVRHGAPRTCSRCCRSSTSSSARSRSSTSPAAATDIMRSLARRARSAPSAVLVVKRGPMGCAVIDGAIPASLDDAFNGTRRARRRAERAGRRRRVLVGLPVGLGARRGLRRMRALRQRLRRARRLAPRLRAGDADARRARLFPRQRASAFRVPTRTRR